METGSLDGTGRVQTRGGPRQAVHQAFGRTPSKLLRGLWTPSSRPTEIQPRGLGSTVAPAKAQSTKWPRQSLARLATDQGLSAPQPVGSPRHCPSADGVSRAGSRQRASHCPEPGQLCLQLADSPPLQARSPATPRHGNFVLLVLIFHRAGLSPPARLIETNLRGQGLSLLLILLRGSSHGPNYSHTGPFHSRPRLPLPASFFESLHY